MGRPVILVAGHIFRVPVHIRDIAACVPGIFARQPVDRRFGLGEDFVGDAGLLRLSRFASLLIGRHEKRKSHNYRSLIGDAEGDERHEVDAKAFSTPQSCHKTLLANGLDFDGPADNIFPIRAYTRYSIVRKDTSL